MTASVHVPPGFLLELLTFLLYGFLVCIMAFIRCIKQRAGARRRVRFKYSRYNKRETEAPYSSFVAYLLRLPFFLSPDFPPHLPSPPKLNARRSNVSRYFNLAEAGYNTDTDMDTRHRVQEVHS
jgi:hypothetical protein